MGDVLDAVSARIKAPYFGYAVLAFIAWNWRALFLLVMLDGSPELRLSAFDANTNFWRLYVAPIFTGVCVAASAEWVSFGFEWISRKPLHWKQMQNLEAEHQKILKNLDLEKDRNVHVAQTEEALIARAKRDAEVQEIENENVKEKLQAELEVVRSEKSKPTDVISDLQNTSELSPAARNILFAAGHADGKISKSHDSLGAFIRAGSFRVSKLKSPREYSRYESALKELDLDGLVITGDFLAFELTEKGWQFFDEFQAKAVDR